MKKRKVWRYYCEYCKKSGCSGGHMIRHEASCTNNPNRVCGMCRAVGKQQPTMEALIQSIGSGGNGCVDSLRDAAGGCPACMLSAIRQSGIQHYEVDDDGYCSNTIHEFDFKAEKKLFWENANDSDGYEYVYSKIAKESGLI